MYIVKKEMRDNKNKFSPFELSIKPGVDISYPEIKKLVRHSHIMIMDVQQMQPAQTLNQIKEKNTRKIRSDNNSCLF